MFEPLRPQWRQFEWSLKFKTEGDMADTATLSFDNILRILNENGHQIDDQESTRIKTILSQCENDKNKFINNIINSYSQQHTSSTPSTRRLPKETASIILYRYIKNTDLDTSNVISMASTIIPKLKKGDQVDISNVSLILKENKVSGLVFVNGTKEYMNGVQFSRLFKPLSNWKETKSVFSRFWKEMNEWEPMKTDNVDKGKKAEHDDDEMRNLLNSSNSVQGGVVSIGMGAQEEDQKYTVSGDARETECKLSFSECTQCQRIKNVLVRYQRAVSQLSEPDEIDQNCKEVIDELFDDNYTATDLLDDFQHIVRGHHINDDHSRFDSCFEFLTTVEPRISCDISKCEAGTIYSSSRRGRINGVDSGNVESPSDYRTTILWHIHSFLVHSLETTILTMRERMDIEEEIKMRDDDGEDEVSEDLKFKLMAEKMQQKAGSMDEIVDNIDNSKFVTQNVFLENRVDDEEKVEVVTSLDADDVKYPEQRRRVIPEESFRSATVSNELLSTESKQVRAQTIPKRKPLFDQILARKAEVQQREEVSDIHIVIGIIFDIISIIVSTLDFGTDIYIVTLWRQKKENVFFWIGLSILVFAQISYVASFYTEHRPTSVCVFLMHLLCTFWCIPFYPIIFYFAGDESSCLRKWPHIQWGNADPSIVPAHREHWHSTTMSVTMRFKYLFEKFYKNFGFVLESLFESSLMSILQLVFILINNGSNHVFIMSWTISMLSLAVKALLFFLTGLWNGGVMASLRCNLWLWFSSVADVLGICFLASFAFFTTSSEFSDFFISLSAFIRWQHYSTAFTCAYVLAIGSVIYLSEFLSNRVERRKWKNWIRICCAGPFAFLLCFFALTLLMGVINTWWSGILMMAVGGVPGTWPVNAKRVKFFDTLNDWIWNGARNVVDFDDDEIILSKSQDRILRVCVVNNILMKNIENSDGHVTSITITPFGRRRSEKNRNYDYVLCEYLKQEAKTNFAGVSWRDLREHNEHCGSSDSQQWVYRDARFLDAIYYDFYAAMFLFISTNISTDWTKYVLRIFIQVPLLHLFCPFYVLSRIVNLLLPFFVPIYVYFIGGTGAFKVFGAFQVIICFLYATSVIIWSVLLFSAYREEYYFWHILPTVQRLDVELKNGYYERNMDRILTEMCAAHYTITTQPVVKNMLVRRFGSAVADIIETYMYKMTESGLILDPTTFAIEGEGT